jgi:di/tricarboxylate transporter
MAGFAFWYTLLLLIALTFTLVTELLEADIAIFSTLILLILGGVINLQEAFAGFSNHGMLTIGFLFVVVASLQRTGVLNQVGEKLLGKQKSISKNLLRFLPPVAAFSAFFNNTPIVLMLTPVVSHWAKKNRLAASKFLIPLSYAAILGGICTLIGTSTTLVVHGLMLEEGLKGMTFFEISKVGVPVSIFGLLFIILIGHKLLPDRKDPFTQLGSKTREFVVVMKVGENYQNIGKSIETAGLRHLKGLFLFQIEREGRLISPVEPQERIRTNDRLFFTGLPDTIMELQRTPGLYLIKNAQFDLKNYDSDQVGPFEVVISPDSPLIGKNIRESNFRSTYNGVIIAIHRSGERINKKIGDIVLHPGDTLLILARHEFFQRWYNSRHFYLVSKSTDITSKPLQHVYISIGILAAMILAMAFNLVPILVAASMAAIILILTRCISANDARNSVDWRILLIIASAFGIAKGLENSGVATFFATQLIASTKSFGVLGMLTAVYFTTNIYTEIITNNAAAALVFPIAFSIAGQAGIDPRPLLIAVAIAASASFSTPIGYQTNLMVYGPGGYRFKDFLKIGIPLNISIGILAIAIIYLFYF